MSPKRSTMTLCAAALALVLSASAQAQDYPNKPVQFITPAAAGNSPDVPGRRRIDRGPGRGRAAEGRLFDLHDAGLDLDRSADPAG